MAKTNGAKSNGAKSNGAKSNSAKRSGATAPARTASRSTTEDRTWDAIVVGGGHNGLTNAAYLAKAGLKTLVLERRPIFGGAAITEALRPGFWFTTFSYALSLLPAGHHPRPRPARSTDGCRSSCRTFCPTENGNYLMFGQDHGENHQQIARHSRHDADAYDAFNHDVLKVLPGDQAAARRSAAGHLQRRPGRADRPRGARLALPQARQEGPARRGSAADRLRGGLPRRLLRVGHRQGLPRLDEHHRHQGRAVLAGLGAGPAVPPARRARRRVRGVGVSQAGQWRLHEGPRPRRRGRRGDEARVAGRRMSSPKTGA